MSPDYSQQIPQMAESPYARQRGQRHLVHEIGQNEVITINKDVLAKSVHAVKLPAGTRRCGTGRLDDRVRLAVAAHPG